MKILIIRFSSIGDIVLTTPVVRCLKKQLPQAEIHFCSKINFKSILESNPYIDKCHYFDKNLSTLVADLKNEKFDLVIDLHNNLRTRIIKFRLGVESKSFDKLNFKKWLLVKFKINRMNGSHVVDRYLDTVKSLGIQNDHQGLDYFIPAKDEVNLNTLPEAFQNGYIAYAIGGQHATKKLPLPKMIELCGLINKPLVLLGGKEDQETAEEIIKTLPEKTILNVSGKYNLNQSASILKQATKVISHDTGLMHIASAFKKEIIAIWGNTMPAIGFEPYETPHINVENNDLGCRPCSKIGFKACPKGHFKCMNDLDFRSQIKWI